MYKRQGTGSPAFQADVAIKDGRIVDIAATLVGAAKQIVDVTGLAVAPGFIDIHSHSDTSFLLDGRCESKIYQGVTTELAGQCGSTIYPCPKDRMDNIRNFAGSVFTGFASDSFQAFMNKVQAQGKKMSTNLISLIGHGALRCGVMGFEAVSYTHLQKAIRGRIPKNATPRYLMQRKLRTKRGRARYKLRQTSVEPVFGFIKQGLGLRQFLLLSLIHI